MAFTKEEIDKEIKNIITYEMALKMSIHSLVEILQDVAPQVFDEENDWNLLLNECRYRTNDEYKSKCKDEELRETKAWQLSSDIQGLKEQKEWISKELTKKKLELNKLCPHEKIREEYENYPGGYLDKAEHWTYYFCEVCGVKVDEKVKYGGFG